MNYSLIKPALAMAGGFAMIAFGFAAAMAAKMADPSPWLNEVVAIGHVAIFGAIGSDLISDGWQSLKSARAGPEQRPNKKRRTSA